MKKISYKELGKIIGDRASEEFKRFYSDNILDYEDDLRMTDEIYQDKEVWYIEISEVNKQPLIIEFYKDEEENCYI